MIDLGQGVFDVAVIGAGPAGILAAISASKHGAKTLLVEKNDQIGRKILATGNGRCNVSNSKITIDRYHGSATAYAKRILEGFDAREYFESLGVLLVEEDQGRLFPRTNQASTIVEALAAELNKEGVTTLTGQTVKNINFDKIWEITTENGQAIEAKTLILTTGGRAAHQFGSSGDGLFWAKKLGHNILPIHAALVPIETSETWVKDIMGIRLTSHVRLLSDGVEISSKDGDIIFTHYGISGPAVMGLARDVEPELLVGHRVQISLDLTPDLSSDTLSETFIKLADSDGKKLVRSVLAGLVPKNLIPQILTLANIKQEQKAAETSKKERAQLLTTIKDFRVTVAKVRPLKEAQVTAGGIDTDEITVNLTSKLIPNLFFAGEILDIDGDSGGFNLQWAWASGKLAGEGAAEASKCTR